MIEAYSVGIRVSLINGVSTGLMQMVREFGHANMAAKDLQGRLSGIRKTMLVGAVMSGAGLGILALFKPALDDAKQFQQQVAKFELYGMGDRATSEATKFAKAMGIVGSSYTDNMKLLNESQGIFRESGAMGLAQQLEGAKIAAPILAKLSFLEASLSDDEKASRHAQDLAMLRFVEARGGANSPQTFASIADWGYKLSKSSGGVVDWAQLQQLVASAGPMTRTIDQDALSKLEPVIGDLKGGRVGSGLRVAFQRLLGTQRGLPKQAVAEYMKLGLWDPSKVELSAGGGIKRFLGAPGDVFKDRLQFMADPVAFFQNTFLPALAKTYGPSILGNTPDAIAKRSVEESLIFGPGTASAVFSQIDKLMPTIQRSLAAQQKQLGIDPAVAVARKTMSGQELALSAKFHDLLVQTGTVALPIVVRVLEALQPPLDWLAKFSAQHPRIFGGIIDGIILLGVALTVGGVVTSIAGVVQLVGLLGTVLKAGGLVSGLPWLIGNIRLLGGIGYYGIAGGLGAVRTAVAGIGLLQLGAIAVGLGAIGAAVAGLAVVGPPLVRGFEHNLDTAKHKLNPLQGTLDFLTGERWWMDDGAGRPGNGKPPTAPAKPYAKPASYTGGAHMQGAVYLDNRKVGQVVASSISRQANNAPASGAGFDSSAHFTPVGTLVTV